MSNWFDKEYLKEITSKLSFADEMVDVIFDFSERFNPCDGDEIYELIISDKGTEFDEKVKLLEANNPDAGMIMLLIYLMATRHTKAIYEKRGISDEILYDTMQCFAIDAANYERVNKKLGFRTNAWNRRQINGTIIRLGRLEFEIKKWERNDFEELKPDDYVLSIHIPRGDNLLHTECMDSYKQAKPFFKEKFPEYDFKQIICSSWLMGDWLKLFLSENSNIVLFQNDFDLISINPDDPIRGWVFDNIEGKEVKDYPENTSLQRKVKAYLLEGNEIYLASKILKKEIWDNL